MISAKQIDRFVTNADTIVVWIGDVNGGIYWKQHQFERDRTGYWIISKLYYVEDDYVVSAIEELLDKYHNVPICINDTTRKADNGHILINTIPFDFEKY